MLPPLPPQHDFLNDFGISDLEFNASGLVWSDLEGIYSDYGRIHDHLKEHGQQFVKMMWNKDIPAVNSIKIRIKDPLHPIEKVIRKAIDRPQRRITQANYRGIITDLTGIRAIHKYKRVGTEWGRGELLTFDRPVKCQELTPIPPPYPPGATVASGIIHEGVGFVRLGAV